MMTNIFIIEKFIFEINVSLEKKKKEKLFN